MKNKKILTEQLIKRIKSLIDLNKDKTEHLFESKKKNTPTNPQLWKRCLAWAKRRYKVCPSAYCNGAAAKRYKSLGGKWKKK